MRKLMLTLILLCSFCSPSFGATVYSGSSQSVVLSDNNVEDIPNSDWTIAGWIKFSARTGTGGDTILSSSSGAYFLLWVYDASHASKANKFDLQIFDDGSHFMEVVEGTASFSSNTSATHVAVRRSGTTYTLWVNGSQTATTTDATTSTVNIAGVTFGVDVPDGNVDYFRGNMWDWKKWDRALRDDEIIGLSKGFSVNCILNGKKWFYPMGGPYGYYREMDVPITVTNSSTTTSDAQRIFYCN
jgi:hypothetical protein